MKQLLTSAMAAATVLCVSSFSGAAAPTAHLCSVDILEQMSSAKINPTDEMLAQCYGGPSWGYAPAYAPVGPVYRTRRVGYPAPRLNINIGGGYPRGYRGFGPGYGGYGPGRRGGFGPRGQSGFGFFLNL